ncbi:PIN domain-containing protein [Vineibacter terrae]|uniref:PIN domain-containing protein n=1 Tax=Vineibacter terrae TaxID=2586908 RepID=UPI001C49C6C5|nr:PIN domain-containing protein [Vineibacter terrae]
MPVFLDTNILIYSISTAADESGKRDKALTLLDRDDCILSVQVLQEFYVQATRASRPDRLSQEVAAGLIRTWLRFRIQDTTVAVLQGWR